MRKQPVTGSRLTEKQWGAVARAYCYLLYLASKGENSTLPEYMAISDDDLNKLAEFATCGTVDDNRNPTSVVAEVGQRSAD